jgi:DNA-binding NarL/FixJ family response regulator
MAKIRVVLADNHQEVVARVRRTLGEDFDVIGTVEDGNQAVDAVRLLDADVLVIDISMPISNGLEAAKRLVEARSRVKIVFLTIHEDQDFVTAALSAGASAYVTKSRLSADLVPAIREALQGRTFISKF